MNKRHNSLLLMTLCASLFTALLQADELGTATKALCEKYKSCTLKQLEDAPPEMKGMVLPMLEQACQSITQNYGVTATTSPLYQPAVACLKSLEALSCDRLNTGQQETVECQRYDQKTKNL